MARACGLLRIAAPCIACAALCSRAAYGDLYVVAIGIENYERVGQLAPVGLAETDAKDFETYVQKRWNVNAHVTLLNGPAAKKHSIQSAVYMNLTKAGTADAVFLFISARGITDPLTNAGYIVPYDALSENGAGTGIPLEFFSTLLRNRLQQGPVYLFADVCRPDSYRPKNWIESSLKKMASDNGSIRGMLATEPDKLSGEGVFAKALVGAIQLQSLDPLQKPDPFFEKVKELAGRRQTPYKLPGRITWNRPPTGFRRYPGELAAVGLPFPLWLAMQANTAAERLRSQFREAIANEQLLGAGGAVELLQQLKNLMTPAAAEDDAADLRVALEDKAQRVIVDYASGEQFPNDPLRLDAARFFEAGTYFDAAERLERQDRKNEMRSRSLFCKGRAKLFDGPGQSVDSAADDLQKAIDLYPAFPEPFNALGIVHLSRAQAAGRTRPQTVVSELDRAVSRFQKATEIAPVWAYSRHNLALTYNEKGDLRRAEKEYKKAIELTPYHPYLQYNLGLLLQNQNRLREAEAQYKSARSIIETLIEKHNTARNLYSGRSGRYYQTQKDLEDKIIVAFKENLAETYNALGTVRENRRDPDGAEGYYKQALVNANLKEARHNLALLTMAKRQKRHLSDAERLKLFENARDFWLLNLSTPPEHRPSLLGLARAYREANQPAQAIPYFQRLLKLDDKQVAAREELALSLAAAGRDDEAFGELQTVVSSQEAGRSTKLANPAVYQALGDLYLRRKQESEACNEYAAASRAQKAGFPASRDLKAKLRQCPAR